MSETWILDRSVYGLQSKSSISSDSQFHRIHFALLFLGQVHFLLLKILYASWFGGLAEFDCVSILSDLWSSSVNLSDLKAHLMADVTP